VAKYVLFSNWNGTLLTAQLALLVMTSMPTYQMTICTVLWNDELTLWNYKLFRSASKLTVLLYVRLRTCCRTRCTT